MTVEGAPDSIGPEVLHERQVERAHEIVEAIVRLEAEMRGLPPDVRIDAVADNMVERHTLQEDPNHDPHQLSLLDAAGLALRGFLSSEELHVAFGKGIDQKYGPPAPSPDVQQPASVRHAA